MPGHLDPRGRHGKRRATSAPQRSRLIDYPRSHRRGVLKLLPSWRQVLLLGVMGALTLVGAFAWVYAQTTIPEASSAALAQSSAVYYSDGKTLLGRLSGEQNRTSVPIEKVPESVKDAVLAAEDRSFYSNSGVSPKAIVRAFWSNLSSDSRGQGGSTITQQYVRNYYSDVGSQKTYQRKLREAVLAIKINKQKSKDEILQDYLNTIWWGRRSYGLNAAAQAWFPRGQNSYQKLTVSQAAFLAGIIQAPDTFDFQKQGLSKAQVADRKAAAQRRWNYVLDGMLEQGWITQEQRSRAKFPLIARPTKVNAYKGPQGYLLDYVNDELLASGRTEQEIEGGGLRVVTTFDKDAQAAAVKAMDPEEGEYPATDAEGVHAGLVSIDTRTGAIKAMYGGRDYLDRQFNDATAKVQPGSTFKPFALAAALEDGKSLYSTYEGNSPMSLPGGGSVRNEFNQSYGSNVSLLSGLRSSVNTVFVDEAIDVGPAKVRQAIVASGIPDDAPGLETNARIPLGIASVSPLQMALGYSTFAGEGMRPKKAYSVQKVWAVDDPDRVLIQAPKQPDRVRVFSRDIARDVTYAMEQVVRDGTGTEAQGVGTDVAGKTGTHGVDDKTLTAWFVGFTPELSTAVSFYRGEETQEDLDGVGGQDTAAFFGGGYPARIWTAYMSAAVELPGYDGNTDFPDPAYVNARSWDRDDDNGSSGSSESGSEPTPTPSSSPEPADEPTPTPSSTPTAQEPAPAPTPSSGGVQPPAQSPPVVEGAVPPADPVVGAVPPAAGQGAP
nr:transglycosylase domain-containing protein [Motilibacter aurantiacus]